MDLRIISLCFGIMWSRDLLDGDFALAVLLVILSVFHVAMSDIQHGREWRWFK